MPNQSFKTACPLAIASILPLLGCGPSTSLYAKPSLRISSPANNTVVRPGQILSAEVTAVGRFEQVVIIGQDPLGFIGALTKSSPYRFSIPIPSDLTPGKYTLTANGAIARGVGATSDPIFIDVERPDRPTSLKIEPSNLDMDVGDQSVLRVIGTYANGSEVDLTTSTQTTFVSRMPSVVTVSGDGLVTAVGPGSTRILINKDFAVEVTVHSSKK
jgi:hypothetical protein